MDVRVSLLTVTLAAALGCTAFWSLRDANAQNGHGHGQGASHVPAVAALEEIEAGPPLEAVDGGVPSVRVDLVARDAATPVASGRGVLVTAGELYNRVADAPEPTQRAWAATPELINELVDRLVADRLLAGEARRLGLERDPAVIAAVERALVARLRATRINPTAGDASQITPAEIQAFYDAHPTRFHVLERRQAAVIFLTNRREAAKVLKQALATRHRRPISFAEFRALAQTRGSNPAPARTYGELHDVTAIQTDIDNVLRDAIYEISAPGMTAPSVIHGSWNGTRGYLIVRLTGRRPPIDRTLAEAADWIRQRLVLERRVVAERTLVERLATQAHVAKIPADHAVRITVQDAGVPVGY